MISSERKKAMYKKALAALLATTTTLGLAGCGGNEETPKEDKLEEPTKEKTQKEGFEYLPTEQMSEQETKKLSLGDRIDVEELKSIPDEATLEENDLVAKYYYSSVVTEADGTENTYEYYDPYATEMNPDGTTKYSYDGATYNIKFEGIEIAEIANYIKNDNGVWEKYVTIDDILMRVGPVVSQTKIKELDGNQKTLK